MASVTISSPVRSGLTINERCPDDPESTGITTLPLTPENGHVILVGQELLQLLGIDLLDDGLRLRRRHWLRALLVVVVACPTHMSGKTQGQQSTHEQRESLEAGESHPAIGYGSDVL